ncbi:hypothetical protein [Pseudodesulfovibrio tunisiensis]|uniref:hypothetical protein n=1 Tax=Pseudodesulfovibrio tunisiensis TaxID=463192 RepID=UPI001FB4F689|nr:hypothetical protein [Pseudodesulfovibrio tunisiensis]
MDTNGSGSGLPTNEEYAAFVNRNVHKFLPKFMIYSAMPVGVHAGWNWPCFFFSFWWFLYRKMYFWSFLCFISFCIPYLNMITWIAWPILANDLYFKFATRKIIEVKTYHPADYPNYLGSIGGVNSWVPWVAILVSGGLFVLALFMGLVGFLAFSATATY